MTQPPSMLTLPDGGNRIWICARLGCVGHHVEVAGLPEVSSAQLDGINFYTRGDDVPHGR